MTPGALDQPLGSRNPTADPIPRLYPEVRAGGFTRNDHRIIFFARVNALLRNDMTVLDFGAGRGIWAEIESGFKLAAHHSARANAKKSLASTSIQLVLNNPLVDEAIVLPADGSIPLPDRSVDMIISWAVFEHLEDPAHTAAELDSDTSTLVAGSAPGLPTNGATSALAPGSSPTASCSLAPPCSPDVAAPRSDVFPDFLRLNTLRELRRHFPTTHFEHFSYPFNGEPTYHANSFLLARAMDAAVRLFPDIARSSCTCGDGHHACGHELEGLAGNVVPELGKVSCQKTTPMRVL